MKTPAVEARVLGRHVPLVIRYTLRCRSSIPRETRCISAMERIWGEAVRTAKSKRYERFVTAYQPTEASEEAR